MEILLKQILTEVQGLKQGQERLEDRFANLEDRFANLEGRFTNLENDVAKLQESQQQLQQSQQLLQQSHNRLEDKVDKIDSKLNAVFEQTANLIEFKVETNTKLNSILDNLTTVEIVTSQNWKDIAKLKSIK